MERVDRGSNRTPGRRAPIRCLRSATTLRRYAPPPASRREIGIATARPIHATMRRTGYPTTPTLQRHKSRTKRIIPGICDADYRTNCPTSWCLAGWPTGYPTNRSQTAGKPRPDRDQMTPRSASGPAQSYSSSRAGLISSSGRCLAGRVFGLNGNFSARIFSYAAMSSSCWSVRSMSS